MRVKRVMVTVNGAAYSSAAVIWAAALAGLADSELLVATVEGDTRASVIPAGALEGLSLRRLELTGGARQAIEQACFDESVDLLVVGSTGGTWFPAPHLDRLPHLLACQAKRPIAIVPGSAQEPVRSLIIGVNGSPGSAMAVNWVANASAALTRDVVVVHAVPAARSTLLGLGRRNPRDREDEMHEWTMPLRAAGITVAEVHTEMDPVDALCQAADKVGSCVVFGGRPVDAHHALSIGSVGLRLLDRGTHPVIVVPL